MHKKAWARLLLAGAAATGAYAFLVEPRWLQVTRTTVAIPGLPEPLRGMRIGLLSDLHAGSGTPLSLVRRACRQVMAERPDLIALTGDLGGTPPVDLEAVLAELATLDAPLGVYAVPGNHDYTDVGGTAWHRLVRACPAVTDLTNRRVVRRVGAAHLCIAGVDSLACGDPEPDEALPGDAACGMVLLLAHNPDQLEQSRDRMATVDLALCGHTHGGQVRLPVAGALLNSARHDALYEQGLVRRPWAQVYVSRGVGTVHLPVRFFCRPEVAMLTLQPAGPA